MSARFFIESLLFIESFVDALIFVFERLFLQLRMLFQVRLDGASDGAAPADDAGFWIILWDRITGWLGSPLTFVDAYFSTHPELIIGLAVLAAVPVLTLLGLLLPRRAAQPPNLAQYSSDAEALSAHNEVFWLSVPDGYKICVNRGPVTIGAGSDCHIQIQGSGICELHAVVMHDEAGCEVIRMSGDKHVAVYIDGFKIDRAALCDGQKLKIGSHVVSFEVACHGLDQLPVHADRSHSLKKKHRHDGSGDLAWPLTTTRSSQRAEARF